MAPIDREESQEERARRRIDTALGKVEEGTWSRATLARMWTAELSALSPTVGDEVMGDYGFRYRKAMRDTPEL